MSIRMKLEQDEALKKQDEAMVVRVEQRLTEIQEDFLKKTKQAAEQIFEENHVKVLKQLNDTNTRVDVITDYHKVQKEIFDSLTASNNEAIKLHNDVKKVFKDESESFFAERLKWKTDVQSQINQQDKEISHVQKVADLCT